VALETLVANRPRALLLLLVAFFGALYVASAPVSVQHGDTGELVTSAYFLRVPHPPGYPLWNLLYHLPVRYLGNNPFYTAALVTVGISLLWLGGLFWLFRSAAAFAALAVLASSLVVWRYATLPDVFALHLFFLLLMTAAFLDPARLRKPLFLFLVALSVAHHHTVVLALPLVLYALWQVRGPRVLLLASGFLVLALSPYLLLLKFHPEDYGSWGNLNGVGDVVDHFLRKEYGTFRLQRRDEAGGSWTMFFLERLGRDGWAYLGCLGFVLLRHRPALAAARARLGVLVGALVIYFLVFSSLGAASLDLEGEAVFERFLLHPTFFFAVLVLFAAHLPGVRLPKLLVGALIVNAGVNVVQNYPGASFRGNTTIEDYLRNGLRILPPNALLLTAGDTIGFGTYYLKDVQKLRPDVIQMHPTYGFPWGQKKFHAHHPGLVVFDPKIKQNVVNLNYRYFTNRISGNLPIGYSASLRALWFEITPENRETYVRYRCDLVDGFRFRKRPALEDFVHFEVSYFFDISYGTCYFEQGLERFTAGDLPGARTAFERAVAVSPFHARAQERLCQVYRKLGAAELPACEARLDLLLGNMHHQYVLQKY
jgi:hypothetical protein